MTGRRVLVTRPRAESERLATALGTRGYEIIADPLLEISDLPFVVPADRFDAVLLTSRAAVRPLAGRIPAHTPVLTVGVHTAAIAREAGFGAVTCIGETVAEAGNWLASGHLPATAKVLYASGRDISPDGEALAKAAPSVMIRVPVYEARRLTLQKATIVLLSHGDIDWILLFSRRTAEAFAMSVGALPNGDWIGTTRAVCLSRRTAEPVASWPWAALHIAAEPTERSLLSLLPDLGARA